MKTKRVLTPEQIAKRDARRATFRKLVELFKSLSDDQRKDLSASMIVNPEGHAMSPCNTVLVNMQRPGCSIIAGYRQWRKFGRQVIKGERGISIWIPTNAPKGEDEPEPETIRFSSTSVFDISQTQENAVAAN